MQDKTTVIGIIIAYLVINLIVGLIVSGRNKEGGFLNNYFLGNKTMGGFVLAMTLVATFTSASSFIGGPGVAYNVGLSWVFLSMIQVPTAFLMLAVLGKRFAVVGRKIGAVTVVDFLRERYESKALVAILSFWLILFSVAQMIAQFKGGAVLLETVTGLPYVIGLAIFAIIVIIYTSFGGFKAVVITDTIQGAVMVIGAVLLFFSIVKAGGGVNEISRELSEVNPDWLTVDGGGKAPMFKILSFWILVGVGTLGLPQTAVRCMGFKDSKSLHSAMVYGTVVLGAIMLLMHISGVFIHAIVPPESLKDADYVVPYFVMNKLSPFAAGIFIAAPLAAVMSTVSSLLLMASSSVIKDLYLNFTKNEEIEDRKLSAISKGTTLIIGLLAFLLTLSPPDIIVKINLFAMGGMEAAFFGALILGLYWRGANKTGALWSAILGPIVFVIISKMGWSPFGIHAIVPGLFITLLIFVIGSKVGERTPKERLEIFFGNI